MKAAWLSKVMRNFFIWTFLAILGLYFGVSFLTGQYGFLAYRQFNKEKAQLERQIQAAELLRTDLLQEISLLSLTTEVVTNNPAEGFFIEQRARELLNYGRPGDVTLFIDRLPQSEAQAAPGLIPFQEQPVKLE